MNLRDTEKNVTKEEALIQLAACQENRDTEVAHSTADDVLCTLLKALGYGDVVAEYKKVRKWYA